MVRVRRPSLRTGDDLGKTLEPGRFVGFGIDVAQLGIEELQRGPLAGRLVAPHHFQRAVGVDPGEPVGVREGEVVDEAVVAGSAFEVHAHKHLRDVLRGLHLRGLAGVDHAAPHDAFAEPGRFRRGIDQLRDKAVVGHVRRQRGVQPLR